MNINRLLIGILLLLIAGTAVAAAVFLHNTQSNQNVAGTPPTPDLSDAKVSAFASAEEFKAYLQQGQSSSLSPSTFLGGTYQDAIRSETGVENIGGQVGLGTSDLKVAPAAPDRFSTTNVQVRGIDEPDIVKTDGQRLFVSVEQPYYFLEGVVVDESPTVLKRSIAPPQTTSATKVLTAFPIDALAKDSSIDKTGNLLVTGKTLVIFSNGKIYGYDVSDPSAPKETWTLEFPSSNQLVSARLLDGKIYLVTRVEVSPATPCPITPFTLRGNAFTVPCDRIYHPATPVPADVTYTATVLNPATGAADKTISFVGSEQSSAVLMSEAALYVTYDSYADPVVFLYDFYSQAASDLLPASYLARLKKLASYDLSMAAKMTEVLMLLEQQLGSLSDDARLKLGNDLENRMKSYQQKHRRSFEKTGIVKIKLPELSISATGEVPGQLLNQFSLDEYKDTLRVATTSGGSSLFGGSESVNDVYALDKGLSVTGSVLDLGRGERIYSVRFIANRGYVVTFKQTDPFYVIDFSKPAKPTLAGELKIPGYSSYLDPLTDDLVVGVGQEGSQVKVSLFDVSDASDPQEVSKYTLKEYWSEVESNHHAFLQDAKHKVFFLPAGQNGYVLSYQGKTLSLAKALSETNVKRAVYINDYLYVVTADKVVVLKESDWSTAKELAL